MTEPTSSPGDAGTGETPTISVGFSGLGRMGRLMAANLQQAGFDLTVHNRTLSRAESFASSTGAVVATSGR
ncbi:MAG: NAD(P)-binding domain-containing protein, partial [bacterium]|nr:NAD(P)-binding domain-containing protein [bacterium]